MRYEQPAATITVTFHRLTTGLVGTCGVRIENAAGATVVARKTTGIVESPAGTGLYICSVTTPAAAGEYAIVFDDGTSPLAPSDVAVEDLTVNATGLPTATGATLATRADVRQSMEFKSAITDLDNQIDQALGWATQRIMDEVDREIVPTTNGATRVVQAQGRFVDLAPYDLRTVTAVVLDPNGSPTTLALNADYKQQPSGKDKWGVYTDLKLSSFVPVEAFTSYIAFGFVEVQVTGDWGFPSIPQIAQAACVQTVKAWLQIAASRSAYADPDTQAQPPQFSTYALPLSARYMVAPLKRRLTGIG
jgi:hypothetical protein